MGFQVKGVLLAVLLGSIPVEGSAQLPVGGEVVPPELPRLEEVARRAGLTGLQIFTRVPSRGRVVVDRFSARLGGGTIEGRGLVELSRPGQQHRMRVTLSGVETAALIRLFDIQFEGTVQGRIDAEMDLVWSGLTEPAVKRTLAGPVRVRAGEGSITDALVLRQAVEATGVEAVRNFAFASARGAGVFRNGRLDVENLTIGGTDKEVQARGAIDLPSNQVAVRLDIYLDPDLAATSSRPSVQAAGTRGRAAASVTAKEGEKAPAPAGRRTYPAARQLVRIPVQAAVTGAVEDPQFTFRGQ